MKLISLNIWGGTAFEPLMEFVRQSSPDTDIFCFQEVFRSSGGPETSNGARMNVFADLIAALPEFDAYFTPIQERYDLRERIDFPAASGEAIFIRRSIAILEHGERFVYGNYNDIVVREGLLDLPVAVQHIRFAIERKQLTIAHLHGIVFPGKKTDSPARIEQSRHLTSFLEEQPGEKILCGDFNLMPDTESVRMIEEAGMRNLIKDFHIAATRSSTRVTQYAQPQLFADYCFVSPGVNVRSFKVPDVPASDHLPLILDFSL